MGKIKISPSLLSVDVGNIERDVKKLESVTDWLHIDVMDGHFVPNLGFGVFMVKGIKKVTDIPLDVHLMIDNPSKYIEPFINAGADIVTVHVEVDDDILWCLKKIKEMGKISGLALNPDTNPEKLKPYLEYTDMVLQMTVFPGFGGQSMVEDAIKNISVIRSMIGDKPLEVDGGITIENVDLLTKEGADVIVSGSGIFKYDDIAKAAQMLRENAVGGQK